MLQDLIELEYESYNIFGLEIVFDKTADDLVVKRLRRIGNCSQWACMGCVQALFNLVGNIGYLTNVLLTKKSVIVDVG